MTNDDCQAMIKSALKGILPAGKESNSAVWALSKQITAAANKETRDAVKEAGAKTSPVDIQNNKIQEYLDNPMTEEEEAKMLRATLHAQLASGEINSQLLDKLDKIIGVGSGKDSVIELVDFRDAFPDYATAIEMCHKPQPEE